MLDEYEEWQWWYLRDSSLTLVSRISCLRRTGSGRYRDLAALTVLEAASHCLFEAALPALQSAFAVLSSFEALKAARSAP